MTIRTLVLSGGGGRGAFHAGVYKYLSESAKTGVEKKYRGVWTPDIVVGLTVAIVTVFTDLAIAVIVGIIISALVFAWEHAKHIEAHVSTNKDCGWKVYDLHGSLFFASTQNFLALFSPKDDPENVVIEFRNARVKDHSALEAIDLLAERYTQLGKKLHLRHLSPDCLELLDKARGMIEVNVLEDPLYHPADNRLG